MPTARPIHWPRRQLLNNSHLFGMVVLLICNLRLTCPGAVPKRCCSRTCSAMTGKPARGDIYPQPYPQAYSQRCAQSHVSTIPTGLLTALCPKIQSAAASWPHNTHRLLCTRIRCVAGLRPQTALVHAAASRRGVSISRAGLLAGGGAGSNPPPAHAIY